MVATLKKNLMIPLAVAMISVIFFSIQIVTAARPLDLTGLKPSMGSDL